MKKTIYSIVLAVLCLNFSTYAQNGKAIDVTASGIQIGQKMPDILLNNIRNYKSKTAKLSDFKGKLLILDFWATWCAPCVSMIPKMDSLQKTMGDKIQFLSLTYQSEKEVIPFMNNLEKQRSTHYGIPVITEEKELHKLFPHIYLPHYIWIDGEGVVKAITGYQEVTAGNISNFLGANVVKIEQKKDLELKYDSRKGLLINNNGGDGSNLLFHSVLTGYTQGLGGGHTVLRKDDVNTYKISGINQSIVKLMRLAYGGDHLYIGNNRVKVEVKDMSALQAANEKDWITWMKTHTYCYEIFKENNVGNEIWETMRTDLSRFFPQYSAKIEKRKMKCLVLTRTSKADKLKSKSTDYQVKFDGLGCVMNKAYLWQLVQRLDVLYLQQSPYPIVDETGYKDPVDITLNCSLSNVEALNKELSKYDLRFELADRVTEVLVIKDQLKKASPKKI